MNFYMQFITLECFMMLKFSLPKALSKSAPELTLSKNSVYQYLVDLDKKLRAAKDSMEPYFKKYERTGGRNIFKTATSNFESFKFTRNQIAQNRNTPSVSNAWIKAYELISEFGLIPELHKLHEDERNSWNHFDNCSFPGSFILAIYHYVYTMRDEKFQDMYNWFGSSLLAEITQDKEHPDAALGDQYELYKRYPDNWLMNPELGLNGDILDKNYITHIQNALGNDGGQVDLYTSEFGVDVSEKKLYNEQEFVHAKGDLAQLLCGLQTLRKDGHLVCKIFTFFNPFTLSILAVLRECFEELHICKPVSSKPDNSEVFIVGKEFNPDAAADVIVTMQNFLDDEKSDYKSGSLTNLDKLDTKFWKRIKEIAHKIFEELQIGRINNNIVVFDKIISRVGDPNTNPEAEDRIKRISREEYQSRIEDDNKTWFAAHPVLPLHKKNKLDVIDITERVRQNVPRPRYVEEHRRYPRPENKVDKDGFQTVTHRKPNNNPEKRSFSMFGKSN